MTAAPASALSPFEYLIEDILPARELHFIGGPSGSGKTTWVFQLLIPALQTGTTLLGKQAHTTLMCYVACDRSDASIKRTLRRLNIEQTIPYFSILKNKLIRSVEAVIIEARKRQPNCQLVIIDAFAALLFSGLINDYKAVNEFLTETTNLCDRYNITIIGLVHAPKMREGEEYRNPRQRIMGSVAWGAYCETVILIEPYKEDPEQRVLTLETRQTGTDEYFYKFNDHGHLEAIIGPDDITSDLLNELLLPALIHDHDYSRLELLELINQLRIKCSIPTLKRWLKMKTEDKILWQPQRGSYRKSLAHAKPN